MELAQAPGVHVRGGEDRQGFVRSGRGVGNAAVLRCIKGSARKGKGPSCTVTEVTTNDVVALVKRGQRL